MQTNTIALSSKGNIIRLPSRLLLDYWIKCCVLESLVTSWHFISLETTSFHYYRLCTFSHVLWAFSTVLLFLSLGIVAFKSRTSTRKARIKVKMFWLIWKAWASGIITAISKHTHWASQIKQHEQSFLLIKWLWVLNKLYNHTKQPCNS